MKTSFLKISFGLNFQSILSSGQEENADLRSKNQEGEGGGVVV